MEILKSRYLPLRSSNFSLKIFETRRAVPGGPYSASCAAWNQTPTQVWKDAPFWTYKNKNNDNENHNQQWQQQQPTTNNQQLTTNNQQPTTNNQPTTNKQQTTNGKQQTANSKQQTTNNRQQTTNNHNENHNENDNQPQWHQHQWHQGVKGLHPMNLAWSSASFRNTFCRMMPPEATLINWWGSTPCERIGNTVMKSRWHSPYTLLYEDPLLIYLLVSVPSILTFRYMRRRKGFGGTREAFQCNL